MRRSAMSMSSSKAEEHQSHDSLGDSPQDGDSSHEDEASASLSSQEHALQVAEREQEHDSKQSKARQGELKDEHAELVKSKRQKIALSAMEAAKKRGVIYMSRIPPHLKPLKLRHILSQYGEVGRLYLAPEDPSMRRRRKKLQGSTGKMFSEGWIEFEDKRIAKRVAEMLNGNPMGGKKRSAYHYDLWCLKYLPQFKWDQLTEEIAYQSAVREQKLANEISAAKRERDFYLSRVDRAKAEEAKEKRRKKKAQTADGEEEHNLSKDILPAVKIKRSFGQKIAKVNEADNTKSKSLSESVLALVAGKSA